MKSIAHHPTSTESVVRLRRFGWQRELAPAIGTVLRSLLAASKAPAVSLIPKKLMAEKMKRHVTLESAHGKPLVVVPLMVTHIGSRGTSEADVFFVGGASVSIKGTAEEVAAVIFG